MNRAEKLGGCSALAASPAEPEHLGAPTPASRMRGARWPVPEGAHPGASTRGRRGIVGPRGWVLRSGVSVVRTRQGWGYLHGGPRYLWSGTPQHGGTGRVGGERRGPRCEAGRVGSQGWWGRTVTVVPRGEVLRRPSSAIALLLHSEVGRGERALPRTHLRPSGQGPQTSLGEVGGGWVYLVLTTGCPVAMSPLLRPPSPSRIFSLIYLFIY